MIGPGDLVVCVDASPHANQPNLAPALKRGRVYRVLDVGMGKRSHRPNVYIDDRFGFLASRFRPLNDGEEHPEIAERIKRARPAKVGERADA